MAIVIKPVVTTLRGVWSGSAMVASDLAWSFRVPYIPSLVVLNITFLAHERRVSLGGGDVLRGNIGSPVI